MAWPLTSLSRLVLTWRGLSDITKSRLISTEGARPSDSGANWTFLITSFTELLHIYNICSIGDRTPGTTCGQNPCCGDSPAGYSGDELQKSCYHFLICAIWSHRLRTLVSWLSALNALISNSTAHCCRDTKQRRRRSHVCILWNSSSSFYLADIMRSWLKSHWARQVVRKLRRKENVC